MEQQTGSKLRKEYVKAVYRHLAYLTCMPSTDFSSLLWSTVKGFGIVNQAEIDVFLELSCCFDDPRDVSNLMSGSSAFSRFSFNIWKFIVHIFWSLAWRILSITLLVCEMSAIVPYLNILWHCLSLGLEWKLIFPSPVPNAEFSIYAGILSAALCIIFQDLK